jgi:hypothetical protein
MEELVRRELIHTSFMLTDEALFALIDASGGWPVGFKYVSFYHDGPTGDRYCKFTNVSLHTGWWTTICSADDYYYWKLSAGKKAAIAKEIRANVAREIARHAAGL